MKKKVLLLLDPNFSGGGDFTNLLRIGKFLKSKGYEVYSTFVNHNFSKQQPQIMENMMKVVENSEFPVIIHPETKKEIKYASQVSNTPENELGIIEISEGLGLSKKAYEILSEYFLNKKESEKVVQLLHKELENTIENIDYELVVFRTVIRKSTIKRISIHQYSNKHFQNARIETDFLITPIPSKESLEQDYIIPTGFYNHSNYAHMPKEELVKYLVKQKGMVFMQKHLLESKWGSYYSGTLGTNGLFPKLLSASLTQMIKKQGKITYFSFLDEKHFDKFVIPYLNKDIGIIDLTRKEHIVNDPYEKEVVVINLVSNSDIMESIINCSELCSICAGDGSFNIMYNRLRENKRFIFLKYYNYDQENFFRFIVNRIHEFETKNGLNHEISRIFFSFGYYEKIFQYHIKTDRTWIKIKVDQFSMFERTEEKFHLLHYFTDENRDFELMQKLFYDPNTIEKFNSIMKYLIDFIRTEDNLLPVEDVLLEILEKD